ncbi:chemokine (C-X-C motif) ligand 18a, duplicate 1 [Hoplias malabaricus]|uniref:chemokine (C-X-C motif) ligand 18a, duplicate 1 n=1 Tax=Hoplias malabaricus TaxID=27720 RepID=UPI003462AC33
MLKPTLLCKLILLEFLQLQLTADMAFRILQANLGLVKLFFFVHILTDNVTVAISIREKCECVKEIEFVQWRSITDFEVKMPEVLCNKVQIIIKMGTKSVCLNTNLKQGEALMKCWKKVKFNEKKKSICMKPKLVGKRRP